MTDFHTWLNMQIDKDTHDSTRHTLLDIIFIKKRIFTLHYIRHGTGGDSDTDPVAICNEDGDVYPCDTVRLLAMLYINRDGYLQEWSL